MKESQLKKRPEATTRDVLLKKVSLKVSRNSNNCIRAFFKESCRPQAEVFSCKFCEILRIPFLQNTSK